MMYLSSQALGEKIFPVVVHNSVAVQSHLLAKSATQQSYILFQVYDEKELYSDERFILGLSKRSLEKNVKFLRVKNRCTDSTLLIFKRFEKWKSKYNNEKLFSNHDWSVCHNYFYIDNFRYATF